MTKPHLFLSLAHLIFKIAFIKITSFEKIIEQNYIQTVGDPHFHLIKTLCQIVLPRTPFIPYTNQRKVVRFKKPIIRSIPLGLHLSPFSVFPQCIFYDCLSFNFWGDRKYSYYFFSVSNYGA